MRHGPSLLPATPRPPELGADTAPTQETRAYDERCYEIVEPLHQGGMGELFLADLRGPQGFRRRVVLKALLPHLEDDPILKKLFFREARLLAHLHHPNVVQVFDMPVVSGRTFIAMEHVRGRSFHQVLKRARYDDSRIPLRIALRVVSDIARGLHAAHTATDAEGRPLQMIHRDISPGNVLVSFDGEVKIIDFGIAKFRDAPNETKPNSIRGKARYVSPEQIRGKAASFRSDIYAAAVVLADALLGRPLWHRSSINETLLDIATEDRRGTVDRVARARTLPESLKGMLESALSIEPEKRPHSALEMAEQLDEIGRELGPAVSDNELGLMIRTLFQEDPDTPDPAHLLPERATHLSLVTPVGPIMRDTLVDGSGPEALPLSVPPHLASPSGSDGVGRPIPWDGLKRPFHSMGPSPFDDSEDGPGGPPPRRRSDPSFDRPPGGLDEARSKAASMPPPVPLAVASRYRPRTPGPRKPEPVRSIVEKRPERALLDRKLQRDVSRGMSDPFALRAETSKPASPSRGTPPSSPGVRSTSALAGAAQPAFLLGLLFGSALTLSTSLLVLLAE